MDASLKNTLFKKTFFFLIWIKYVQNNFWLLRIQPPRVILDYPIALLSNSEALVQKFLILFFSFEMALSQEKIYSVLFILCKQFHIFHIFCFKHFYQIFAELFYHVWYIMKYMLQNVNICPKNKKFAHLFYDVWYIMKYMLAIKYEHWS